MLVILLLAAAAAGVIYAALRYHGLSLTLHGVRGDDDNVPERSWSEVAGNYRSTESPYGAAEKMGFIIDRKLREVSGITYSRLHEGNWWVHNDSGDAASLYAIDSTGRLLGTFRAVGAVNEDWEDIATGPGADGSPALYVADTGNNSRNRDFVVVYRVKEPDTGQSAGSPADTQPVEPFQFVYPDGKHDAEALIVDPQTGRIYIITKSRSESPGVYRSPSTLKTGTAMTLERMQGNAMAKLANLRLVTGGAASPDGSRVMIRTYFTAYELYRAPGKGFETVFDSEPVQVTLPLEPQGEAISYSLDGKFIVTTSEQIPAALNRLTRK